MYVQNQIILSNIVLMKSVSPGIYVRLKKYSNPSNKYKFIKKMVDGSVSTIYLGSCKETGKRVIIKRIPKKEEWMSELDIIKSLPTNDKLVQYLSHFIMERYVYIITSFYEGYDLFEHIDINVPYKEDMAVMIIREMARCIQICHNVGIAHLDIKCENFMVTSMNPPRLILIDFGHSERVERNRVVYGSFNYGTYYYLCPEGYSKYFSFYSDIWSLGICSYLILTGEYPKENKKTHNVESLSDKISDLARDFLEGCFRFNPEDRFSIEEVINHKFLSG